MARECLALRPGERFGADDPRLIREPPTTFAGKRSSKQGHGPRIRAVRCKQCAFLELYADGPVV